jgi:hypothetical protein
MCAGTSLRAQNPLWTADLQSNATYRAAASNSLRQSKRIVVLDDNNILVLWSFLHKDSSSAILTLIDGSTGAAKKSLVLGEFSGAVMVGRGLDIARLGDNRFLLLAGEELRLGASPALNWIRIQKLPSGTKNGLYVSPSGKTVFVNSLGSGANWFSPDLLVSRNAQQPVLNVKGITDGEFIGFVMDRVGGDVPAEFNAAVQPTSATEARRLCGGCAMLTAFGDDYLALRRDTHLRFTDHQGKVTYQDPREVDPTSVEAAGSARTDRVAFTYISNTREGTEYVVDQRVAVLDVAKKRDVFGLSLSSKRRPMPDRLGFSRFDLLLSPDGRRLAIIRDNVLRYFALP